MCRFFIREPWGWGETKGFDTLTAAEAFCDKYNISRERIEDNEA